jgi:hypothetical protein
MTGKISAFSFLISFVLAGLLRVLFVVFCPLGGKYRFSLVSPLNPKDFDVLEPELVDLGNSGQKKLLMTLYCTFPYTARKQCLINLNTRDVKTSPISGTTIRDRRFLFDLDQDGKMEASENMPIHGNIRNIDMDDDRTEDGWYKQEKLPFRKSNNRLRY